MLERLAARFLNAYVAEYVGNVVTDQLSIGLLQGAVELEKLPLKKDSLRRHQLPIDIVSGYIGKLRLQLPAVHLIKSQPWEVRVEQLYVILGPAHPDEYNAEEEERKAQQKKASQLAEMERRWKEEQKKKSSSGWWFLSSFSLPFPSNVIANLQVIINDIHIRYEDSSAGVSPFAVGVMVSSLSAQSTDKNWEPKFMSGREREYKLMDMSGFCVYWDRDVVGEEEGDKLVLSLQLKKAAVATQQDTMSASTMAGHQPSVDVIIKPTGGRAKLTRNCSKSPLRLSEGARFLLDVQLDEIPVVVTDTQYCALVRGGEEMRRRWRGRRWRKWKPVEPVKGNTGKWWVFAINSVLERVRQRNRRCSLDFFRHRARQSVAYVRWYTEHLTQTSVSEEGKRVMEEVEKEQSYEEVVILRNLVMTRIKTERDLTEAAKQRIESESGSQRQPGVMQRWFTGWMTGYQGQQQQQIEEVDSPSLQVEEEEEEELLAELGYDPHTNSAILKDSILLQLSFSLGRAPLTILSSLSPSSSSSPLSFLGPEPLVRVVVSSLCCSLDLRPRVRGATFELSLGGVTIEDLVDDQSQFPVLVQTKGAKLPVGQDQVHDHTANDPPHQSGLETHPPQQSGLETALFGLRASLETGTHINFHIHSKPLDIVYNRSTITQLRQFLLKPWSGERGRTYQQLGAELRSHTTAEIRHRLEELLEGDKKTSQYQISVRLNISAPRVIIPDQVWNRDTHSGGMVIVDLGHVTFGSVSDWSEEHEKTLEQSMLLSTVTMDTNEDEDEDDEFATPPSSPPGESEVTEVSVSSAPSLPEAISTPVDSSELSSAIHSMASTTSRKNGSEKYLLKLSELQVLVGSEGQPLQQAVTQESSHQHLLEKFTLSVRLQSEEANLSLWASLPSLRFHVDEEKVQTLFACLHPLLLRHPSRPPTHSPSPPSPLTPPTPTLKPRSAFSPERFLQPQALIEESMYYSLHEGHPHDNQTSIVNTTPRRRKGTLLLKQLSGDGKVTRQRYQQLLLVATEKLVSAYFSIDEVFLTLSSKGQPITELRVPGVKLHCLRRPHDTELGLTVQDLCVVDRIQTFGPEFELLLCSGGKSLLRSPSFALSPLATTDSMEKSSSCPTLVTSKSSALDVSHSNPTTTEFFPIGAHLSTPTPCSREDYSVLSPDSDSPGLLSVSYTHLSPLSPDHPAMREAGGGGSGGEGDGEREIVLPSDGEPKIHKVSVHCTAVDVMANQETMLELISFFQRAVPLTLLTGGGEDGGERGGPRAEEQTAKETERDGGRVSTVTEQPASPVHMEVDVMFDRLGVRMLRRIRRTRKRRGLQASSAQLIASITFFRLSIETQISNETSLVGRLAGVRVEDLTPVGKKYRDVLTLGDCEGRREGGTERELGKEGKKGEGSDSTTTPQDLCFSVNISPQAREGLPTGANDVRVSVTVPSIYYTHSVNLVYELETFVSEFQEISRTIVQSFSSAAVGVAKGLVQEKSQLAEQLSTSFGPQSAIFYTPRPPGGPEIESIDAPLTFSSRERLYLEISIQSPVIVLPSSLQSDKCLVAFLGEVSLNNVFMNDNLTDSLSTHLLPERERVTLHIKNISLHATHSTQSRAMLIARGSSGTPLTCGHWWEVLHKTSVSVEIERRLGSRGGKEGDKGGKEGDEGGVLASGGEHGYVFGGIPSWTEGRITGSVLGHDEDLPTIHMNSSEREDVGAPDSADVTVTGQICDHLLIKLPKEVFDQIRLTMKHGIHRKIRTKTKKVHSDTNAASSSNEEPHPPSHSVTSSYNSEKSLKSEASLKMQSREDTVSARFSLPRLSLELKHTIDSKEKDFVYISFEDFNINCHSVQPHVTSVDLALKSIAIEDLLQEKKSQYRYLLASSTKPPSGLSPASSMEATPLGLPGLPLSPTYLPHTPHPLFKRPHPFSSTPRVPLTTDSPLRAFTPQTSTRTSLAPSKLDLAGEKRDSTESAFTTPKTSFKRQYMSKVSGLASHGTGMVSPETSFTGQKTPFESEKEETGSTLLEDAGCHSNSTLSDAAELLSVKAMFVDKECPEFESKHNSVSGHVDVEFSSASVIINLQTWVLLLDYLGIGIPTPPPSPSSSLLVLEEDEEEETQQQHHQQQHHQQQQQHELLKTTDQPAEGVQGSSSVPASLLMSGLEQSVYDDITHSASLPSPPEYLLLRPTPLSSASPETSLYSSAWLNPLQSPCGNTSLRLPSLSEKTGETEDSPDNKPGSVWGVEGKLSFDISLSVRSLTVTFNKPEHPLAQGVVSTLSARVEGRQGNVQLSGSLGQASVVDLTETGAFYRERFTTTGDQALTFEIFKYGRPDPDMERPWDISARVEMTSVRYLHTMRFLKEMLAFCSHFPQLIDAFQRMKAMAQGNLVYDGPQRKTRISLDVDLTGPVLLIPKHAFSPDLMVGDIGHVRVTNSTRYDGEEGTLSHMRKNSETTSDLTSIATPLSERGGVFPQAPPTVSQSDIDLPQSHPPPSSQLSSHEADRQMIESRLKAFSGPCLLDCIQLDLTDVDVFSACKVPLEGDNFKIVRQRGKVLKEKGAVRLYVERNLYEDFCRDVPDLHIEGSLSAIHVMLDKSQLELVKGLVDMNLGEGIEDFEKPSTVIRDPIAPPVAAEVWTGFLFRMKFVGVQLEFIQQRQSEVPGSLEQSLALFDIQDSEFSFQSRSNQRRTVDFTNHVVIGYDTRYNRYEAEGKPSVFSEVLRPRFKTTDERPIQVQIHVTLSPTHIEATILLNKLRLIGLFDLLLLLKSFVVDKIPEDTEQDIDEVDFSLELPHRDRLTHRLKWPPPTPASQEKKPDREVKVRLSITETDIVVVENLSSSSSNAVVLKGTLILKFRSLPNAHKTLYTSIDALELFSCNLDNEDESALSILDPVTITLEIKPPSDKLSPGPFTAGGARLDVGGSSSQSHAEEDRGTMQTFEIEFRQLNFRLSYNDLKLFLAIAQSLPPLSTTHPSPPTPTPVPKNDVDEDLVKKMLPLGFSRSEIRHQLYLSSNNADVAAGRLLDREREEGRREGKGGEEFVDDSKEETEKKKFSIGKFELVIESLSVCLIDDSANRDVPLLDLSLSQVQAAHDPWRQRGEAAAEMTGDYYNRHISAWEPVLEPWRVKLMWEKVQRYSTDLDSNESPDRVYFKLTSPDRLCINITSSLIQILALTQASWRQDLQNGRVTDGGLTTPTGPASGRSHDLSVGGHEGGPPPVVSRVERGLALLHSMRFVSETRQRSRFVPFLLRNSTGLPLQFATLTSTPSEVYVSQFHRSGDHSFRHDIGVSSKRSHSSEWMEVESGQERPFDFTHHSKRRHQDTRSVVVHQLLVKVDGWHVIGIPVSVDKIGIFFREVYPKHNSLFSLPPSRSHSWLVFAISLSDTQKIVNIRSSLVLRNTMEILLEVKLEKPDLKPENLDKTDLDTALPNSVVLPPLPAKGYVAIPLHLTDWNIRVRPQRWGTQYCSKHLAWRQATGRSPTSHERSCEVIGEEGKTPFRFCVSVQRENFPPDTPSTSHPLPAHTLTLFPPLTITNLLPYDLQVFLGFRMQCKMIRKGTEVAIYLIHTEKPAELKVALDGFSSCEGCTVSLNKVGIVQRVFVRDARKRTLRLTVTSEAVGGSALKVSISCAYWLVNRTGLPLVFRQKGAKEDAAGQWEEHERASTTSPLLYDYHEGDLVERLVMRLGKEMSHPLWCSSFQMISDSGVVRVFTRSRDGRPDQEFQIGVDIRRGRSQYQNTRIVTFVARYQLENRTQYRLAYLQRHQLQDKTNLGKKLPVLMPSSIHSFHWPRTDLDQLFTVKVEDISSCQWSGGFTLNKDHSFHIHMRGTTGHSIFVRCNVTLNGATYRVIFSDAAPYPIPFRLENLSQIGVTYHQHTPHTIPHPTPLNPSQSVPYAWDEPTLPEKLCLQVQGSRQVIEFDLERFGERGKLYYERYFYIAASATFPGRGRGLLPGNQDTPASELVLDVPQGTAVIFQRRDPNRRSQLWRMTPARQLVHISSSTHKEDLVLDIAGRLPPPGQFVHLVVQRKSEKREHRQTWRFTEDGRLLLDTAHHLCVQSPQEHFTPGADVVLGHVTKTNEGGVPFEQQLHRHRHSPGSGVLTVSVRPDGPTRVLRITDQDKKYTHTAPRDDWIVADHGQMAPSKSSDVDSMEVEEEEDEEGERGGLELELSLTLDQGVGLSLINSVPEELVFASVDGLQLQFTSSRHQQCVNLTVQHIQVDNQLTTSPISVVAYPTPPTSGEPLPSYPVIKLFVERVPHKSPFTTVFKLVEVRVHEMTLLLEERLLFKLLQWAGLGGKGAWSGSSGTSKSSEEDELKNMISQRSAVLSSFESLSRQFYFESLCISDTELRVSMNTTSQLPEDLLLIKKQLELTLVKFESPIFLAGFYQAHLLDNPVGILDVVVKHYKRAIRGQAIKILGSVDFLGNPVGLVSDVASGVAGVLDSQDVIGLVRDVTHGMSDTTSKLTGTVSHVLGQATFDSSFQEERAQVQEQCQTTGDHLKAGFIGLSSGVFGGMTSIFTQPYRGARESGVGGFITGVGKGLLGTVAKPVAGLFDLASGTTAALRESTSRLSQLHPPPVRLRRCCIGSTGTLTCYSQVQAKGQEYLLRINDGAKDEKLVSYEMLREDHSDHMRLIISSQSLYFFRDSPPDPQSLAERISLSHLLECRTAQGKTTIPTSAIILSLTDPLHESAEGRCKTRFKCSNEKIARKVAQLINYAKNLHEEEKRVIRTLRLQQDTIW